MASTDDLTQTLKEQITEQAKTKAMAFGWDLLPGPIQTAFGYYLNGITIPIGNYGYLKVIPTTRKFEIEVDTSVGTLEVSGSATQATVKMSFSGEYAGASITLSFSKGTDGVSLGLKAEMGDKLTWKISDLWPSLLSHQPFTELTFAKGELELTTTGLKEIEFKGSGSLDYKGDELANAALRVVYNGDTSTTPDATKVGVLFGIVVPSWSPGSIWSQLSVLTFKQSGLLFSSIAEDKSSSLADLNLISGEEVPSIVGGDFKVPPGITFFTTLELENFLSPLKQLLGEEATLALYANAQISPKKVLDLEAKLTTGKFKPGNPDNSVFQFNGFDLKWVINQTDGTYDVTASTGGSFYPPGQPQGISLTLASTIRPQDKEIDVNLTMEDWVKPFGYEKLTVNGLTAGVSLGGGGVTISLGGSFQFTVSSGRQFDLGVAGSIVDFEAPGGIAFLLKDKDPDGDGVELGDIIEGITSVDVNSIPVIEVINDFIQVKTFDFWVVVAGQLIIPKYPPFKKGFGMDAVFTILHQEHVTLKVDVEGQGSSQSFSGLAKLDEAIEFSDILTIAGYDPDTKKPTKEGPELAIASKGQVVKGVNDEKPVYFYASGYVGFLDVISAYVYGLATKDGLFRFVESVQVGSKQGNSGVWAGETIWVGLNAKKYQFSAGFAFKFGWTNESVGPLKLWGVELIPKVNLPDFDIEAALGVDADGTAGTFELDGALDFDFLEVKLNYGSAASPKKIISLSLSDAPSSLDKVKDQVWKWFEDNVSDLLQDALKEIDKFLGWVKDNFDKLVDAAVAVAKILEKEFGYAAEEIAKLLKQVGYLASMVYDALKSVFEYLAKDLEELEKIVDGVFQQAEKCATETAGVLLGK